MQRLRGRRREAGAEKGSRSREGTVEPKLEDVCQVHSQARSNILQLLKSHLISNIQAIQRSRRRFGVASRTHVLTCCSSDRPWGSSTGCAFCGSLALQASLPSALEGRGHRG